MTDFNVPERPTLEDANPNLQQPPRQESNRSLLRPFLELLQTLALAAILYFAVDAVLARVIVENISMEPTLYPGNFVLVNRVAYRWGGQPRVGEIVIFHNPQNLSVDYIKRIIGTPGDTVVAQNGKIYVNGAALTEPYISAPPEYSGQWTVPPDSIFVLGDNRNNSEDSHIWGFVPMKDVIGKALVVYWPVDNIKVIAHPTQVNAGSQ
ncbi:MAG TPA: signal peptidase I [Anaerolineaceae bacterium]|nr:signal peptidase I [Anaerolineaceae bacterium]